MNHPWTSNSSTAYDCLCATNPCPRLYRHTCVENNWSRQVWVPVFSPMMHWGRLGWVWRCSKSSSSQLCSRADVTAGGKGKKKNRSNYSSNYLIISLCGGEQEGGWRRALCFLSPSALPSWWALSSEVFTFLLCLCRFHCDSHPPLYLSFDLQHKHENQQERREGGAGVWKC